MSKKQQKVLKRIVVALLLLIAVSILDALVEMPLDPSSGIVSGAISGNWL